MGQERIKTTASAVKPPGADHLGRLNEADRHLLQSLLSAPLEHVEHPLILRPEAETVLFGGPAKLAPGATYFVESDSVDPAQKCSSRPSLLDREQEVLLFLRFNYARSRMAELLNTYRGRRLPFDRLRELLGWAQRAMMARGQIVQANLGLAPTMAARARGPGVDLDEMIAEGQVTLLRSVDRFDCSLGCKFSTYACRALIRCFQRLATKMRNHRRRFPLEFDPALERSDYADRRRAADVDDCLIALRGIVRNDRDLLSPTERIVLQERFRLDGEGGADRAPTLVQLGSILGVTKERVRQIQISALEKLRRRLERDLWAA